MENLKSKNNEWLYLSIRYEKYFKMKNLNYGDEVYKCNFLIYGDIEEIKEIQDKHKSDFYIGCCYGNTYDKDRVNVFDYVNPLSLKKEYVYVNFFENFIDDFKFKIKCESEEDFFNKFFNLCEKSINEENKTLYDLLNEGVIEEITTKETFNKRKAILYGGEKIKCFSYRDYDLKNYIVFGTNEEIKVVFDYQDYLKLVSIKDNTRSDLITNVIWYMDYFNEQERRHKEKIKESQKVKVLD